MSKKVRTRFAPSPTGYLHLGSARTALYAWLWARKNNGDFILRIEDTDEKRSTHESSEQILESMKWLGLDWDEGPFYQSERMNIYKEHLNILKEKGYIYPAFDTPEELEKMREELMAKKENPIYDRRALKLSPEEVKAKMDAGVPFVWRFKVPDEGYTEVKETLMGDDGCSFENSKIGDFVITRPGTMEEPGMPLYNFVCVIDDALMEITNVIRGVEHLTNTPKQVLLYNAFGYDVPTFTHLPLILKKGKKMSKRDKDIDPRFPVSISERRDLGYLKEATLNFVALLGWSPVGEEEFFTVDELTQKFTLERLHKGNANFDEDKYLHQNAWYIRNLPLEDIVERSKPFFEKAGYDLSKVDPKWFKDIMSLEVERCKILSEFPPALDYFFNTPTKYDAKGVKKLFQKEDAVELLSYALEILKTAESFDKETLHDTFYKFIEAKEMGMGKIAQPMRLALTGRTFSPGLFEMLELISKDESIKRIETAINAIKNDSIAVEGE